MKIGKNDIVTSPYQYTTHSASSYLFAYPFSLSRISILAYVSYLTMITLLVLSSTIVVLLWALLAHMLVKMCVSMVT